MRTPVGNRSPRLSWISDQPYRHLCLTRNARNHPVTDAPNGWPSRFSRLFAIDSRDGVENCVRSATQHLPSRCIAWGRHVVSCRHSATMSKRGNAAPGCTGCSRTVKAASCPLFYVPFVSQTYLPSIPIRRGCGGHSFSEILARKTHQTQRLIGNQRRAHRWSSA